MKYFDMMSQREWIKLQLNHISDQWQSGAARIGIISAERDKITKTDDMIHVLI